MTTSIDVQNVRSVKRKKLRGLRQFKNNLESQYYSYFYIVKCNEFYKLGFTHNIKRRMGNHQSSNPYPLELYFSIKVDYPFKIEQRLIEYYSDKKIRGEWFRLNQVDLDKITNFLIKWQKISTSEDQQS